MNQRSASWPEKAVTNESTPATFEIWAGGKAASRLSQRNVDGCAVLR